MTINPWKNKRSILASKWSILKSVRPALGNTSAYGFQEILYILLVAGVLMFVSGCAPEGKNVRSPAEKKISASSSDAGLPKAVYCTPEQNIYYGARAVIQVFGQPFYLEGVGKYAARGLSRQLSEQSVFQNVRLETEANSYATQELKDILAQEDCDLLITGHVLFFLEGSTQQPSQVAIEAKVYEKADDSLHLLWHLHAEEVSEPRAAKDLYLFRLPPVPALSGQELINKCTAQFVNALLHLPPRQDAF